MITYLVKRDDVQEVFIENVITILKSGTDERKHEIRCFMNNYGVSYMHILSNSQIRSLFNEVLQLNIAVVESTEQRRMYNVRSN